MKVKPINRHLGFLILCACCVAAIFKDQEIVTSVYLVGAFIFDAIKTINEPNQ